MMGLRRMMQDDDAVSPVIGVILMVAITVILAAVIASFVLGLGDQAAQTTPQASFSFDYDTAGDGTVTITHDGGDSIDKARLEITSDGGDVDNDDWSDDPVSAGSTNDVTLDEAYSEGDMVRVVWKSADGDSSSTLSDFEVPSDA